MDFDEASDEIDEIQQTLGLAARIDAFRRRSDELEVGEDGRAEFLACLAGELELNGDVDDARAAYLEAINDGGPTELEPRCGLLSIELTAGHDDRVTELLRELLAMARAQGLSDTEHHWVGESLEAAGRFREAMRWFTIPLRDIDPDDIEALPIALVHGRWRVRRELGLPQDAYDEARDLWMRLNNRVG
jgi:tetratricopeptide (TPR) repeat protein